MTENNENGIGGDPREQSDEEILESVDGEAIENADGASDERVFVEEDKPDAVHESIYNDERFLNDPGYLLMLNKEVFQAIADSELYKEEKIEKKNVAIIDIDISNSTAELEVALEKFEKEDTSRTPDIKAVEDHIPLLMTVHDAIVDIFGTYGIKGDKFLGDGAQGLCEGGVHQAIEAAKLLKLNLSQYGLDVRIGIDVGDVTIVGCGSEGIKKAFLTGDTVKNAEKIQKNASIGDIALSENAQKAVGEQSDADISQWRKYRETSVTPGEIKSEIEAREMFLPTSRVYELRYQYLSEKTPSPSVNEVCTLVIDLPDIEDQPFDEANEVATEIFKIVTNSGGEVDKIDGRRVMANFVAGRSDFNGVQAGIRMAEALNELNISFRIAAARSNALSVVMGGDRTVIGRVANLAHREVVDAPRGVLVVDEDLMRRVETQVKKGESIGTSKYKGVGERETFAVYELKGWYELARAEKLLFRQDEIDEMNRECYLVGQTGGRCMAVAGRQGFGKSALVAEFLAMKRSEGKPTYFGRAEEYTSNQQFAVWRDLFSNIFGLEGMDVKNRTRILSEKFPHLQDSLALINPILDTRFERTALIKSLENRPDDMREMQSEIIAELISSLSRDGSIATVLLEDMQFFDKDSQKLLIEILRRIKDTNSFLVVTTRPHDPEGTLNLPPKEFDELDNVGKMELGSALPQFDDKQWEKVKEDWWTAANLCVPLDKMDFDSDKLFFKRMFGKIFEQTEGNFRAFETYLRSWTVYGVQKGYFEAQDKIIDGKSQTVYSLIRDESGNPRRISDEDFKKLGDVSGVETRRFYNLELPKVKNVLLSASVIGPDFSVEELLYISDGLDEEEIVGLLGEAERRGFVRHIRGDRYAFANNEIGTAIYRTRSEELDPTLQYQHRLMGQYYQGKNPDDLHKIAFHLRHSDDYLATLEILDKMTDRFKEPSTRLNTIEWASRAFAKIKNKGWKSIPVWSKSKLSECRDINKLGINQEELVHEEIKRLLLVAGLQRRISVDQAVKSVKKAQREFGEFHSDKMSWSNKDYITWCKMLTYQARNYDLLRQLDDADKIFGQIFDIVNYRFNNIEKLDETNKEQARSMLCESTYFHGLHLSGQNEHDLALDKLERALVFADQPKEEAAIRNGLVVSYMYLGDYENAQKQADILIDLDKTYDLEMGIARHLANFGQMNLRLGNFERAIEFCDRAIEAADKIKDGIGKLNINANRAFIYKHQNEYQKASDMFSETIRGYKRRGKTQNIPMLETELVFCMFELGNFEEASEIINRTKNWNNNFRGRGLTLQAINDLLLGSKNIDSLSFMFDEGIGILEGDNNSTNAAFDKYFFGEKLVSLGYTDIGEKYLREAKNYYEKYKTPILIPKIDKLLGE